MNRQDRVEYGNACRTTRSFRVMLDARSCCSHCLKLRASSADDDDAVDDAPRDRLDLIVQALVVSKRQK